MERLPNLFNLKQLRKLDLSNCLRELHLAGCKSSFLARTFTKRFFEILSGFGHRVEISLGRKDFKDTVEFGLGTQLTLGCRMSSDLRPNESQNFLAIILALDFCKDLEYSVMNIESGFIWSDTLVTFSTPAIVIVPSSIFLIRDGDDRIEITADRDILCGIHLQYKTGITMISEFCSTADNVEDERSNSWQQ
ncbi:hypothetical protein POM88_019884 [Heracleum sosnowskyi]|uniref:Uncharacterized protein n=1 Tax=Heracleum sosnowskyi TaxID=360622 RepID=A0AAD8IAH4_9APIA|nr:hypothetical protein POM88_019884 [Heracleum sosnowskyi]